MIKRRAHADAAEVRKGGFERECTLCSGLRPSGPPQDLSPTACRWSCRDWSARAPGIRQWRVTIKTSPIAIGTLIGVPRRA